MVIGKDFSQFLFLYSENCSYYGSDLKWLIPRDDKDTLTDELQKFCISSSLIIKLLTIFENFGQLHSKIWFMIKGNAVVY